MYRAPTILALAAAFVAVVRPGFSQEYNRHEVAGQAIGSFVTSNTKDGVTYDATHSGGVLGTYRFFFSDHHGVEANYGYARNTQSYASQGGMLGIRSDAHEV